MSNPRFFPVREEPMDRDEINRKIQAMIEERNKLYSPTGAVGRTGATATVINRMIAKPLIPLTKEEMDDKRNKVTPVIGQHNK
jgi:hypothetical protein